MSNHTAESLLAAVGVDWKNVVGMYKWDNGLTSTQIYTGPALGAPELDAALLVESFKWIRKQLEYCEVQDIDNDFYEAFGRDIGWESRIVYTEPLPGHALAAAIKEVKS